MSVAVHAKTLATAAAIKNLQISTGIVMAKFKSKFESKRQDWETPDTIFVPLRDEFDITFDTCATSTNTKCKEYFTPGDDALSKTWFGTCWMNPPFSEVGKWVRKAFLESQNGAKVVCLLPARTNTNWWHDFCMKGEIRFIRGRPKFKGAEMGLPQPLAIVIFSKTNSPQLKLF